MAGCQARRGIGSTSRRASWCSRQWPTQRLSPSPLTAPAQHFMLARDTLAQQRARLTHASDNARTTESCPAARRGGETTD